MQCQDNESTSASSDKLFNPRDYEEPPADYVSLSYKARAVAYADAHPNYSISTLQYQGFSKLKRKGYLSRWRNDVASGGTRYDKLQFIDSETFERFKEARNRKEQVSKFIKIKHKKIYICI